MSRGSILATVLCLVTVIPIYAGSFPATNDNSQKQNKQRRHDSFVDFALDQINPDDQDYGRQLETDREVFIEATAKQAYFWTATASMTLLLITFSVLLAETRKRKRHDFLAARFLAGYHNELLAARTTASEAVKKYEELRKATDISYSQPGPRLAQISPDTQPLPVTPSVANRAPNTSAGNHELVTELNMLRQERPALLDTIKNLRQQLNDRNQKNRSAPKEATTSLLRTKEDPSDVKQRSQ